ncbi:heme exporter protein D [Polynucleobacter sphagniphilus]|uniref:heme exporter protein CcmD n=1 Tax=Polynucleobacter sphagniphilus TaxID=1743169 RepID=UPI0024744278|nr:heme exporter protein CcmD [Polynucleobacter sphagniphilus]MDH6421910.1 heme exporter protein D [Polynucleobacter sphagniphilus]
MIWDSVSVFFAMGGYALHVWSSFGMCALVLIAELVGISMRHQAIVKRLQYEIRAEKFDQEGMK